jgi:hypothetical protein
MHRLLPSMFGTLVTTSKPQKALTYYTAAETLQPSSAPKAASSTTMNTATQFMQLWTNRPANSQKASAAAQAPVLPSAFVQDSELRVLLLEP